MATSQVISNLVGGSNRGKFPKTCGSELSVNMYRAANGKVPYQESMPGLKMVRQIGGKCRGVFVTTRGLADIHSPEDMYVAMGNRLMRVTEDTATKVLTLANNGLSVTFAETGGPRAMLLVCDGSGLFAVDLETGDWKQVQLPAAVNGNGETIRPTHVAVVNGAIVVNDVESGYVYYSNPYPLANDTREVFDLQDGQVQYEPDGITVKKKTVDSFLYCFYDDYGTQQFFLSESSSDNINGLVSVGQYLYVFGSKSAEIYSYLGEQYNTWSRVSFTTQTAFGLEAPDSLAVNGNTVTFIASGHQYGKCVMAAVGTQFTRISEDWLDEKLDSEDTTSCRAFTYAHGGHSFYVLQLDTLGQTWCYDGEFKEWHQRCSRSYVSGLEIQWRVRGLGYWHEKFYAFTGDGGMYLFGPTYWWEDYPQRKKVPVVRHRQTPAIMSDNRPFIIEEVAIECNSGSCPDQMADPKVLLEVSKDGGETYGNVRTAAFGKTGHFSHRVRFHALGMVRQAVLRVTFSEPMDFVITDCDIRAGKTGAMI